MPTSLIETREIEAYLAGTQLPEESVLFEAKLILQPALADKVMWQERTLKLLQLYNHKKLKAEISEVEKMLFNDSSWSGFRKKILRLFSR